MVPDVSIGALRVWQRHRYVFLRHWRTELLGFMIEPFIVIVALGLLLGRFVELDNDQTYVQFLAPGLLALFPMFAAVFECAWGSYVRLEMQGTYEAIIATPVSVDDAITGEILWGTTRAFINATYILLVALVLHPALEMLQSPWVLLVIPFSIIPGLLFSCISIAFASIARAMSQFAYFFNLIINPMFWFAGAFFPFEELPRWMQTVGFFIPLKHVVDIYRGLVSGEFGWNMLISLIWLCVITLFSYVLAIRLMRRRLIQ